MRYKIAILLAILVCAYVGVGRCRHSGSKRDEVISDVRHYLNAWITEDYHSMYAGLSEATKRRMAETEFVRRIRESDTRFAKPLRIVNVRIVDDKNERWVMVEYTLASQITEERARQLRKLGVKLASAGRRISSSKRIFVKEKGKWRMYILPKSDDKK